MRIAHISDFHARHNVPGHPQILRRRSRQMPELIAQAIAGFRDLNPDVLIVSGDLVDAPFYGMDDPAMVERITQDLRLIREKIDPVGCPVLYLFGNHDLPSAFAEVFPDAEPDITIDGYRFISFYDEEVRDNTAERLGSHKARFEQALGDTDQTPQIHLQHYMIWPEHNEGYPHAYREAADLKTRITTSGKVVLSLSGHYHSGSDACESDGTWFATSRAFCEPPHPYRIYDVADGRVVQTEHTIGSPPLGGALFLDMNILVHHASGLTDTLKRLAEDWALIGISDTTGREPRESEIENDSLVGRLTQAGCELDAVVCRRPEQTGALAYQTAQSELGVDLKESRSLVSSESEARASQSAGIITATTTPDCAVSALERLMT